MRGAKLSKTQILINNYKNMIKILEILKNNENKNEKIKY